MSISVVSDKSKFLMGSNDRVFKTLVNSGEKGKIILEAGDNSYRYAGVNPNNYVCFGSDEATCPTDNL